MLQNNICFNERQEIWTTRYDWSPIVSENIDESFYSIGGLDSVNGSTNNKIWSHDVKDDSNKPTIWFKQQHSFEFEFVVNEPTGVHKIIENLQILSNNVQPEQLTFEIIGDAYQFNKERILHTARADESFSDRIESNLTNKDNHNIPNKTLVDTEKYNVSKFFRNTSKVKHFTGETWDGVSTNKSAMEKERAINQFHISIPQECRNIETFGRRLGNIHYKGDSWYTNVEPIIYDHRLNDMSFDPNNVDEPTKWWDSTRIRDKWCKIKIRYTGEDLAIITAIRTIINI